jgi:hypothetical protein
MREKTTEQPAAEPTYEPYVNPMAPKDDATAKPSEHTNKEPAKPTPAEPPKEPAKKG